MAQGLFVTQDQAKGTEETGGSCCSHSATQSQTGEPPNWWPSYRETHTQPCTQAVCKQEPPGQGCWADLGRLFPTCAHNCDAQGPLEPRTQPCLLCPPRAHQARGHSVLAAVKPCNSQATSHGRRLNKYLGTTEDYGLNNLCGNIFIEQFCRVKLPRKGWGAQASRTRTSQRGYSDAADCPLHIYSGFF